MNLQEFINYRTHCPICDSELITGFHTRRRQTIKFEEERITAIFTMDPINRFSKTYRVIYSFDKFNNTFSIDFTNKEGERSYNEAVPIFLLDRFRNLNQNLGAHRFFRECTFCSKYEYGSNKFNLHTGSNKYDSLDVYDEHFVLSTPIKDGYRHYKLRNLPQTSESQLLIVKDFAQNVTLYNWSVWATFNWSSNLSLPMIPFVSRTKTLERLENLLPFL